MRCGRSSTAAGWSNVQHDVGRPGRRRGRVEADGGRFDDRGRRSIVNAGGVWADDVRALDEGTHPDSIRPAKGVHITPAVATRAQRHRRDHPGPPRQAQLFLVPWGPIGDGTFRHVYVGTTDTDYDGSMDDPSATADDIDYLLEALNQALDTSRGDDHPRRHHRHVGRPAATGQPHRSATGASVDESTGRRIGETKDLSRRHQVAVSSNQGGDA